jgi:hypothetical protein
MIQMLTGLTLIGWNGFASVQRVVHCRFAILLLPVPGSSL